VRTSYGNEIENGTLNLQYVQMQIEHAQMKQWSMRSKF